ncbi:MAG: hypothetical protein QXR44_01630 [Thermoproteota archaeon]
MGELINAFIRMVKWWVEKAGDRVWGCLSVHEEGRGIYISN